MAKIVQVLTRPSSEYDLPTAEAQVRDLDAIVEKLNTTFQQELKRKEEQARVDATRRMAQENKESGTGGYQAGYDDDFMGGSGTAADMGSS